MRVEYFPQVNIWIFYLFLCPETRQKQLKSPSSARKQICYVDAVYDLNKNIIEIEINQSDMKQNRNN